MPETDDVQPQAQKPAAVALQTKFERGIVLHQQGKLAAAERIYREVLQLRPNHFDALHLLGVIALQTGHTERAIELIEKAIGLNAKVAAAHSNLGKALLDLKRPKEALASFEKAIALKPDNAEAHNNRGSALLSLKRTEEALASFDKALGLKRDYPEGWDNLACALHVLCCWKEAEEASRKAVALKPDFTDAWTNLAFALYQLGRWDEAVVACRTAVTLKSGHINAWDHLGCALIALGRWSEAEEACRKAVAFKLDDSDAWKNLSRALSAQERASEAAEAMRRAVQLKPNTTGSSDLIEENLLALQEAVNRLAAEAKTNGVTFALKAEQIRALHRIAMRDLQNPGEYRKRSLVLGKSPRVPPNWADVPTLMDDMCRYVNANWNLRNPIHLGAFVLWRLVWIHPFDDGNKRIARAVCSAVLCIKNASPLPATKSFVEAITEKRAIYAGYITCLNHAYDTYSQTQNFDQATRHVEQWLEPLAKEYFKT